MTAPRLPTEPRGTATAPPPPTRPPPPPPLRCWACDGAATPASVSASTAVRIDLVIGHLPVCVMVFATLLPTTEVEFGAENRRPRRRRPPIVTCNCSFSRLPGCRCPYKTLPSGTGTPGVFRFQRRP